MSVKEPIAPTARPRRLTAAAAVAALEGFVLAGWGISMIVAGLTGGDDAVQAEMGGLTVLGLALMPLAAAYGLLRARRWSRGPALIIQLVALPVAWALITGGGWLVAAGAALAVAVVCELVLLVHPATTAALSITDPA